ncbi:hypothetical protein [Sinorhizobium meliloti]
MRLATAFTFLLLSTSLAHPQSSDEIVKDAKYSVAAFECSVLAGETLQLSNLLEKALDRGKIVIDAMIAGKLPVEHYDRLPKEVRETIFIRGTEFRLGMMYAMARMNIDRVLEESAPTNAATPLDHKIKAAEEFRKRNCDFL